MATGYLGIVNQPERVDPPEGEKESHYFSERSAAPSKRSSVRLDLPDLSIDLTTDRGVFSGDRIDPGTKLLLMELPTFAEGPVLDLGCGYGPIASTLAKRRPGQPIWAVDVNERALALCGENLATHAPPDTFFQVMKPEDVPADERFIAVVSNPPIRVGKKALHEMLEMWLGRLLPDGEAWLVVHKHLGADSLSGWLGSRGYEVEKVRSRQGYRVLRVTRLRVPDVRSPQFVEQAHLQSAAVASSTREADDQAFIDAVGSDDE